MNIEIILSNNNKYKIKVDTDVNNFVYYLYKITSNFIILKDDGDGTYIIKNQDLNGGERYICKNCIVGIKELKH